MECPIDPEGVHRLTGMRCGCGYELVIPPIMVSIEVTNKSTVLVNEGFNCDTVETAISALRQAADTLEKATQGGE